ncbi:MAG: 3-deoxy-8-phosphooctulonate synthase, partial [Proteobacteria bacterium]|nr:3-deoxy-8-phosphooctulonate synthase [Pseudomonadota bacterium]
MVDIRHVTVGNLRIGNDLPLTLIAGPCAIEGRNHALETAEAIRDIAAEAGLGLIYKSSFDKANRTSSDSPRGIGMAKGLDILAEVRETMGCPVITDVHLPEQCAAVAAAVDVLQIPAYLCRQTDLIVAAAETGRVLNIKKGQFLAPWDMAHVVAKAEAAGNASVMVCERGTSFRYTTLL